MRRGPWAGRRGWAGARHSLTLPSPAPSFRRAAAAAAFKRRESPEGERAAGQGAATGRDPDPRALAPLGEGTVPRGLRERACPPNPGPDSPAGVLHARPRGDGVGAPSGGAPLGRSALGAHGASPSHLGSRASSRRAAGDSFVVSAHPSGRKGTEEAERRGGLEHRARDKQVGVDGCVGETRTRRCQSCAHGWDGSRRHRPRWPAGCDAS